MPRPALIGCLLAVCVALAFGSSMLGGSKDAPVDEATMEVARFAVSQLQRENWVSGQLKLGKVVSAKRQVVAGTNHILTLETSDGSGLKHVEVKVWEKLPSNVAANEAPMQLTSHKLLGGPTAEGDERWTKPAQQAVAQLNMRSNSLFPYQLLDVLSATPGSDGSHELLCALKRGDKHETFALTVKPSADEHWTLVSHAPRDGPASS